LAAALGALCLAVLAAGCGGSSNAAAGAASTTTGTTTTAPGGGGGNAATFQAFRDCLTQHGVTLPARPGGGQGGTPPAGGGQPPANGAPPSGGRFGNLTPKQQQAMTACQSLRPAGGGFGGRGGNANGGQQNPAFAKYTACLKSHGVTFGSTSSSSSAFTKATAACKSLLPSGTGGSANGGTTTTTP
jgi:hypothetical protein